MCEIFYRCRLNIALVMRMEFIMQKRKADYMRSKSWICWEKKSISNLSFYKLKLSIYILRLSLYKLRLSIEN